LANGTPHGEWDSLTRKQQLATVAYMADLAAGADVQPTRVELLSVGPYSGAEAVVSVNLHWAHADPELVEEYIEWLQAAPSAERFPSLAASNLFVGTHTFGAFWEPRHTVQLDVLLAFPGVSVISLLEDDLLAQAFTSSLTSRLAALAGIPSASVSLVDIAAPSGAGVERGGTAAHFRLLFTAPTSVDSLAVKLGNRAAADAFLADLGVEAITGLDAHAPNSDPFVGMMGNGPGLLEPLNNMTHEVYVLPDQTGLAAVAFTEQVKPLSYKMQCACRRVLTRGRTA
jgi:hypothetical protein